MARGVLGVRGSGQKRRPAVLSDGAGIAVGVGKRDRVNGPPQAEEIFRLERRHVRVGNRHVQKREEARILRQRRMAGHRRRDSGAVPERGGGTGPE